MASQRVKGITIDLDVNANAINESLRSVNKELGTTGKELKDIEKGLKFDPKNVVLLSQKQSLLTDAIDKTNKKLETLGKLKAEAEKGGMDETSKEYRQLEREIESTTHTLRTFQQEQESVNQTLEESNNKLSSVGSTFKDVFSANLLSGALLKSIELLANGFIKLGNAMYSSVVESGKFADDINTLAKQYNLSTKELQAYSRASELIDVDLTTIATSMTKLTKNMTSTSSGVVSAFKKLGVETKNVDGSLRDSNEVFNETISALSKIANETEQDNLALQIFGRGAAELGTLIGGGAEQLAEFNKYLEENNLILSQEELDTLNGMNDSFDTLGATFDAMKDKIAVELAPVIQEFLDRLTQFLLDHKDEIVQFITDVITWLTSEEAKNLYDSLVKLATDVLPEMVRLITQLTSGDGNGHSSLLGTLIGLLDTAVALAVSLFETLQAILTLDLDRIFGTKAWDTFLNAGGGSISSGGFGNTSDMFKSGGFASGGIVLNNSFNITNGSNINEQVVRGWTMTMIDQINEQLGGML